MKNSIFNGLILLAFLALHNCEKCIYEMNVDYIGKNISTIASSSIDNCCNSCSTTSGCAAWSFDTNAKTCTLKSKMSTKKYTVYSKKAYF